MLDMPWGSLGSRLLKETGKLISLEEASGASRLTGKPLWQRITKPDGLIDFDLMRQELVPPAESDSSCELTVEEVPNKEEDLPEVVSDRQLYIVSSADVPLFQVKVQINEMTHDAVVDTGACTTLIAETVVNILKLPTSNEIRKELKTINRNVISVDQSCLCPVSIGGLNFSVLCYIVPEAYKMPAALVLGTDFLTMQNLELGIRQRRITKHLPKHEGGSIDVLVRDTGDIERTVLNNVKCKSSEQVTFARGDSRMVSIVCPYANVCSARDTFVYDADIKSKPRKSTIVGHNGLLQVNSSTSVLMVAYDEGVVAEGADIGTISTIIDHSEDADDEVRKTVALVDINSPSEQYSYEKLQKEVDLSEMDTETQEQILQMLEDISGVFSTGKSDIGCAAVTEHHIELSNYQPIYQRPRRFPKPISEEIENQCEMLRTMDVIEPSSSPWSAPIVPVRKKDGTIRLCVDYRKLNEVTIADKHPIPNLNDCIYNLHGTKYFTCLDVVQGYYHIPMDDESKELTAFSTSNSHYHFKKMPFGLKNAPASFQWNIQSILSGLPSRKVIAYIDDILIMSDSLDEHIQLVQKVLQTLYSYGIKIKPSKCVWFKSEVRFLGHVLSQSGIKKYPEYVEEVENFPKPTTVRELQKFLGLVNFQRKFVPSCSLITKPLTKFTGQKRNTKLKWTEDMENAFVTLKSVMKEDVELAYPNYDDEAEKLQLWVDASLMGCGACLTQVQNDTPRVIAYASMTFSSQQRNYSTHDRELAALRWAIKHFRPFLFGIDFVLHTDHQPLVYLNNMRIVCSRLARTLEDLAEFNFEIRYTPGNLNCAADALSRLETCRDIPGFGQEEIAALPLGLVLCGQAVPGGGDSLFVSLHRLLQVQSLLLADIDTPLELRKQLVSELVNHASQYNLSLNRQSRKELKLMMHGGQLPCLDVLLAASKIYSLKINVYFWSQDPVVYYFQKPDHGAQTVLNLQCLGGIHFNALIEQNEYSPIVEATKVVTNVSAKDSIATQVDVVEAPLDVHTEVPVTFLDVHTDEPVALDDPSFSVVCNHHNTKQPQTSLAVNNQKFCALVDTGAEISLIIRNVLNNLTELQQQSGKKLQIVGLTGQCGEVSSSVLVQPCLGSLKITCKHEFYIVDDNLLPCCFLLGIDFLTNFSIDINFATHSLDQGSRIQPFISVPTTVNYQFLITTHIPEEAEFLAVGNYDGDLRFKMGRDNQGHIQRLELFSDTGVVSDLQKLSYPLRVLKDSLSSNKPLTDWVKVIAPFKRYYSLLQLQEGVLLHDGIPIIDFNLFIEIALVLHHQLAHMGRGKLLEMMKTLAWNPSQYKIINDICTTCEHCQLFKSGHATIIPPTFKIVSTGPFQLLAADLVTFPRTSKGNACCLVVVDHFTKWVTAVPLKNKKAGTVATALQHHVLPCLPRIPEKILTDNGSEFTAAVFQETLKHWGIAHLFSTPYHPEGNGAVERVNGTIGRLLSHLKAAVVDWDTLLPTAVITYNTTYHSQIKTTPSQFILGHAHEVPASPAVVRENIETWTSGHAKYTPFKLHQLVVKEKPVSGHRAATKFEALYDGPYTVTAVNANKVSYGLRHCATGVVIRAHHNQLKFWKQAPDYLKKHPYFKLLHPIQSSPACLPVEDSSGEPESLCDSADESSSTSETSIRWMFTDSNSEDLAPLKTAVVSHRDFSGFAERSKSFSGFSAPLPTSRNQQQQNNCSGCAFELDLCEKGDLPPSDSHPNMTKTGAILDWVGETWEFSAVGEDSIVVPTSVLTDALPAPLTPTHPVETCSRSTGFIEGLLNEAVKTFSDATDERETPCDQPETSQNEEVEDLIEVVDQSIRTLEQFIDSYKGDSTSFQGFTPTYTHTNRGRTMQTTAMLRQEIQRLRLQERAAKLNDLRKQNDLYLKNQTSTCNSTSIVE